VPGTVFIYGPELNRALFTNQDAYHKCALSGPLYPAAALSERTRPLGRLLTGLFHVNGAEHRRHRRLLMPAFHKTRIEEYCDDMVAITEDVLRSYGAGQVRDLRRDMTELTLRVVTKTLFGEDMGQKGVGVGRDLQRWLELFRMSAALRWDLPGLPYRRWLDLSHAIDRNLASLVLDRRRASARGRDMLSMLLDATDEDGAQLDDDQLMGHLGVIFAAGHETSSNALCWTVFLLCLFPRAAADLQDELDTVLHGRPPSVASLASLPRLEHVIQESLRLLPPVPFNHRIVAKDTELGGYNLPRNTEVITSVFHTQRMPQPFEEPECFRPERWRELDPGPYAYNPFGAGPRMCIGATFAMMELKIVLATLLQRFRFELPSGSRVDRYISITMMPKAGLKMMVRTQDRKFGAVRWPRGNAAELLAPRTEPLVG
jgi:cytochrome P450